jgi:hypothetical protein
MDFPTTPDTQVESVWLGLQLIGGSGEQGIEVQVAIPVSTIPGATSEDIAEAVLEMFSVLAASAETNKPGGSTVYAEAQFRGTAVAAADLP